MIISELRRESTRDNGARTRLVGTLGSLILIIGWLSACSGGKKPATKSAAAPPPPPSAEESAPAAEPAAEAAPAQATKQPSTAASQSFSMPPPPRSMSSRRATPSGTSPSKFLRDPWFWPEIWYVNPQIENPHLIYPGDELSLGVGANGKPRVTLTRGVADRLSPQMRSQPLEDAIKAIPYEIVASFMSRPSVLEKGTDQDAALRACGP